MTKDIYDRIKSDFGEKSADVFALLEEINSKHIFLNTDRIIRCVLFLSEKNIEKLKTNINAAITDPRDVMLWAEYINLDQCEKLKRVRDFNKTFDRADKDIQE